MIFFLCFRLYKIYNVYNLCCKINVRFILEYCWMDWFIYVYVIIYYFMYFNLNFYVRKSDSYMFVFGSVIFVDVVLIY